MKNYPIDTPMLQLEMDLKKAVADAIDGVILDSPIGVAELENGNIAWQLNIVDSSMQGDKPMMVGRCSPDYSYSISDPHLNPDKTGQAVLNIWNERVNIALDYYDEVRRLVLVISADNGNVSLYETAVDKYRSKDYAWSVNSEGHLVGTHKTTGKISFTWKPIGSQFFIHESFSHAVKLNDVEKFGVKRPKGSE